MKIRTQLVVVFLLLAVVPLTGIVLYSYYSSQRAVRRGLESEALSLAKEMDARMASIKDDLTRRVYDVADLPATTFGAGDASFRHPSPQVATRVLSAIGDSAPLFDSFAFIPEAPEVPLTSENSPAAPGGATPSRPSVPIVIDVASILRETATDARRGDTEGPGGAGSSPPPPSDGSKIVVVRPGADRKAGRTVTVPPVPAIDPEKVREIERLAEESRKLARAEEQEALHQKLLEKERALQKETKLLLGRRFEAPVTSGGQVVGRLSAAVSAREVLGRVLRRARQKEGDIPFALDSEGTLYVADEKDRSALGELNLSSAMKAGELQTKRILENWVIATARDEDSGLTFGLARPIAMPLAEVRRNAARNFSFGLGLIALALLGILPIASHVSRDVETVTKGADRIARGDLQTRVPIRSKNEFGRLATAFNQMAQDLSEHQQRLIEEERRRKEQELQQRLLNLDYERKTEELEEARRFQLSLLPKSLPEHPSFDIAVFMKTATEVGGDYYDFQRTEESITAAIGDATGHGARAGTMVTIIKSLFIASAGDSSLARFLEHANLAIRRMELGRMSMGLALCRLTPVAAGAKAIVASAGMPPLLVHRGRTKEFHELAIEGAPLGTLDFPYADRHLDLEVGDTLLLMSDGFPELLNEVGEPLGYEAVELEFRAAAARGSTAAEVVGHLTSAAETWHGGSSPNDDITFVVIRVMPQPMA